MFATPLQGGLLVFQHSLSNLGSLKLGVEAKSFATVVVLFPVERIGEEVGKVVLTGDVVDADLSEVLLLLGVLILDINVLGPLV